MNDIFYQNNYLTAGSPVFLPEKPIDYNTVTGAGFFDGVSTFFTETLPETIKKQKLVSKLSDLALDAGIVGAAITNPALGLAAGLAKDTLQSAITSTGWGPSETDVFNGNQTSMNLNRGIPDPFNAHMQFGNYQQF